MRYRYQQTHAQSCGAASLMVAAKELSVTTLPHDANYGWIGNNLDFSGAMTAGIENLLYAITSNFTFQYSMPAYVAKAARRMGLKPTIHLDNCGGCCLPNLLQCVYPQAMQDAHALNIDVEPTGPGQLENDERELKVVGIAMGVLGLHYILHRPDGTYMDPADGLDYNWYIAMGQGPGGMLKYKDTGISVVLKAETVELPDWGW